MDHFNEGYDVESRDEENGDVVRYIEVKGLSGAWNNFGVKLSPAQIQFAGRKKELHWTYVVEFALDPARRIVHAIHNPLEKATEFRLDGEWKKLSDDSSSVTTNPLKVGSKISYDGCGIGEVLEIEGFGAFNKLHVRFDSGETQRLRHPDPKITLVET